MRFNAPFSRKRRLSATRVLAVSGVFLSSVFFVLPGQAATEITKTRYNGRSAYRLSDGKREAVFVSEINRVLRFGEVGGRNWLWNNSDTAFKKGEWRNWGGDKTWLAPQSQWQLIYGRNWPPDEAIDGSAVASVEVIAPGKLRTSTRISRYSGARVVREYSFDRDGSFVINQTVEKKRGGPLYLSAWSVTQIVPPEGVFLPLNAQSPYKDNFLWLASPRPSAVTYRSENLLQVTSDPGNSFKIGTDAPVSSIGAFKAGVLFTVQTPKPAGDYPDGALGAGTAVELWNNGDPKHFFNELELLSPLRLMYVGTSFTHTMKWRLQRIQSEDDVRITGETRAKIEAALNRPF